MKQVVIENPVINSPFEEPSRHFRFTDDGITDEIVQGRRTSSYFVPIAKPKKKGRQAVLPGTEWTQDRVEENKHVNEIRRRVSLWRKGGYTGVTPITAQLLAYWTNPEREKKFFFCQIEALETATTSPRWPKNTAMPGSRTRCARPTTFPTLACRAWPSRWPQARARPWSWPCSWPGRH
jgi:hypothetical protein